jgi:hypothetical protein
VNLERLKQAESAFLTQYPGGFEHPLLKDIAKKHKGPKMTAFAQDSFSKENFSNPLEIAGNMLHLIGKSSMVSVFEKMRVRDLARDISTPESEMLSEGMYSFLYGNQEKGFEKLCAVLADHKLSKWAIVTVCPFYMNPNKEVFVKPTTAKGVISHFELNEITYHSTPTFSFYKNYRKLILEMKSRVDPSLAPDCAYFSGFLMMTLKGLDA